MCTHIHTHTHIYMWRAFPHAHPRTSTHIHAHPRTSTHIQFLVLNFHQFGTVVFLITDIAYLCLASSCLPIESCFPDTYAHIQILVLSFYQFATVVSLITDIAAAYLCLTSSCLTIQCCHTQCFTPSYAHINTPSYAHINSAKLRPAYFSSIPNPKSQVSPIFALRALV